MRSKDGGGGNFCRWWREKSWKKMTLWLPEKYDHVSDIIIHREPFSNLKTVQSMLTTAEMRLKSRAQVPTLE
ncbi:hypothetical protein Tco_1198560 [Tanacetum coccineum]